VADTSLIKQAYRFGLRHLATASTGEQFANGRPLHAVLHRLRRLQRQLDRQRRAVNPVNYLPDGRIRPGASEWHSSQRMHRTRRRIRRLHERAANLRRERAHQLTTALTREFGVFGVERLAVKNMLRDRSLARQIAGVTVFTCEEPGCDWVCDRDLNAALNLAAMALEHAQAEGQTQCYVARTGRVAVGPRKESDHARGGQVRPARWSRLGPMKREGSPEPSQTREGLAVAT
jgi:transposase